MMSERSFLRRHHSWLVGRWPQWVASTDPVIITTTLYIINIPMQAGERVARDLVERLDGRVWDQLAEKAITKMPRYKLANESEKMFDDFAVLTSNPIARPPGKII